MNPPGALSTVSATMKGFATHATFGQCERLVNALLMNYFRCTDENLLE